MKCAICGSNKTIQKHHLCYHPPLIIFLCKNHHIMVHRHGTGKPNEILSRIPSMLKWVRVKES